MNRVLFLVGLLGLGWSFCLNSQAESFYRVATSSNSVITQFSTSGVLTWSNAGMGGTYLIEKSPGLETGTWTPWTRGDQTNVVMSVKVMDTTSLSNMVFVPGGKFLMGDSQRDTNVYAVANPVHAVVVSAFWIDRYEVTNEKMRRALQYAYDQGLVTIASNGVYNAMGTSNLLYSLNRSDSDIAFANGVFRVKVGRSNYPTVWVNWYGAVAYCNYLSALEGRPLCYNLTNWTCQFNSPGFRLPTEAEWEFAARGGYEGLRFPWADTNIITHSRANYRSNTNNWYDVSPTRNYHPDYDDGRPRTSPVDAFAPNNYGLHDMAGNNWEWVWDWHGRYPGSPQINPTGPATGSNRIFRGGSWFTYAERLTCAMRYPAAPAATFNDFSFRVVLPSR